MVSGQIYKVSDSQAKVNGKAPVTSYTGVSGEMTGNINFNTGDVHFEIPLKSIDTGIDLRNKHMRNALETEKYPIATFDGELLSEFDLNSAQEQQVNVQGDFTIHGQSKNLQVNGNLQKSNSSIDFNASFDIMITNFGIERPNILFYKVKDKHTIEVSGTMEKEN